MKAARIHEYGEPDVLVVEEVADPEVGPRDVLVRVHATAVNPIDWKIRQGSQRGAVRKKLPTILGMDVSGVIEAVGDKVTEYAVGDAVFSSPSHKREGTYAELVAIDVDEVAPKPTNMTHAEAASIPLVGLTAWRSLVTLGKLKAGENALIQAGAGGVGSFAIQLAKHLGATVATTCSERNVALCEQLGADIVVDYNKAQFDEVLEPQDLVLDALGGDIKKRGRAVLRRGGRLIGMNAGLPANTARFGPNLGLLATGVQIGCFKLGSALRGKRTKMVVRAASGADLAEIGKLIEANKIRAVIDRTYPLDEIAEAHTYSQTGRAQGKIIIQVVAA